MTLFQKSSCKYEIYKLQNKKVLNKKIKSSIYILPKWIKKNELRNLGKHQHLKCYTTGMYSTHSSQREISKIN